MDDDKLTGVPEEGLFALAGFIFATVVLKTILHAPSRGLLNFTVSILSGYLLGFLSFLMADEQGMSYWLSLTIAIFVAMIGDRIFAAYLAASTVELIGGGFKKIVEKVIDKT